MSDPTPAADAPSAQPGNTPPLGASDHQGSASREHAPRQSLARRLFRWFAWTSLTLALLGAIAAELIARYHFQLGNPPLFQPDPQMRYIMAPSATYQRLGNTITYNRFSMRGTRDFDPDTPKAPDELRVLVIGDSVINGGPFTDDKFLATRLLEEHLSTARRAPALVMNASAGSWGPPQELAYLNRFGLFGADVLVIVLNHEDAFDDGLPRPLGSEQPTRRPLLALQEVIFRYGPIAWNYWVMGGRHAEPPKQEFTKVEEASLRGVRDMINLARARNARVVGVLHYSRGEINDGIKPGLVALRQQFRELNVPIVETAGPFREALRRDEFPFRDDIHPSPRGQFALVEVLKAAVEAAR
jgi:hypothetical protein